MANNKKSVKAVKLSPNIVEILSSKHYRPQDLLSKLSSANLQKLNKIASEESPDISRGDRIKALRVLAQKRGKEGCKTIGSVIGNKKENSLVRAAAATIISLCPPDDAEKRLTDNLSISDEFVLSKVVKSLGAIGGEKAFDAIEKMSALKTDLLKKQARFAKSLIAYRLGLEKATLPFVPGVRRQTDQIPKAEIFDVKINKAASKEISNCLQLIEGSNYAVNVSDRVGFKVNCGKTQYYLLFDRNWTDNNYLSLITKGKHLAGLLALKSEETGTYSVQSLILTSPQTNNVLNIMVCRTDGEILFSGQGHIKRDGMDFSITDIERRGSVPLKISGMLTEKTLGFQEAWATKRRKSKQKTMALKLRS